MLKMGDGVFATLHVRHKMFRPFNERTRPFSKFCVWSVRHILFVVSYRNVYMVGVWLSISVCIRSERIIDALENMFSCHGYPVSITSDNGPQFSVSCIC